MGCTGFHVCRFVSLTVCLLSKVLLARKATYGGTSWSTFFLIDLARHALPYTRVMLAWPVSPSYRACSEAFVLENVLGLKQRHPKILATTHRLLREAEYVRSPHKPVTV